MSPKHSSTESKPEKEPKTENQGVQTWAGITKAFSSHKRAISARSREVIPTIGLPSERRLAHRIKSALLNFSTDAKLGKKNRLWILLTLSPWEYIEEISVESKKRSEE